MGSIKDRNGMDLTEEEDIKKRWQEYTEELYKKDLHDPDNHDGVISDLEPARLPRPWDSPGENTGVGCHFLLQCRKVKSESEVTQSCPALCNPMDCSLPSSSVHGTFQERILEWVAIPFCRGSS